MPAKSTLRPVAITRRDGVATTVWRKDDIPSKKRGLFWKKSPAISSPVLDGHPVDFALDFDARNPPEVAEPSWWGKFSAESESGQNPLFPSTPELLDVIPSPLGDIAVIWQPVSQYINEEAPRKSGFETSVLEFRTMAAGEDVGHLKTASVSDESFTKAFGEDEFAPFRWKNRNGGRYRCLDVKSPDSEEDEIFFDQTDTDGLYRHIWAEAHVDFRHGVTTDDGRDLSHYQVKAEHSPEDINIVKADVARYVSDISKGIENARGFHLYDAPYIDFSTVGEVLRGSGFGSAMYIYAAKRLGADGRVLRASGSQSAEAVAMWVRMSEKLPDNVTSVEAEWLGEKKVNPALDFRNG